jgi:hypothetical protein
MKKKLIKNIAIHRRIRERGYKKGESAEINLFTYRVKAWLRVSKVAFENP